MGLLKKAGHKISHGFKKLGKSVSFKRGIGGAIVGGILGGPAGAIVGGVATGAISNAHNKHKAHKNKHKNSIFNNFAKIGKGCGGSKKSGCCGSKNANSCGGLTPASRCGNRGRGYNDYPMEQMNNNMMMGMFNNIINRLLSILQQFGAQNPISNIYNNYNTYNTYPTTNYNTANYSTTYDNDVINTNVNGVGNSIFVDA